MISFHLYCTVTLKLPIITNIMTNPNKRTSFTIWFLIHNTFLTVLQHLQKVACKRRSSIGADLVSGSLMT